MKASRSYFRARINGHTMLPFWQDRDVVEFVRVEPRRYRRVLGRDCFIRTRDGATFRRIESVRGGKLVLRSLRPGAAVHRVTIPARDVIELGQAIGALRVPPKCAARAA